MSWMTTLATYAVAYMFLSLCVGLVLGRILRTVGVSDEMEMAEMAPEGSWVQPDYRAGVPDRLGSAASV